MKSWILVAFASAIALAQTGGLLQYTKDGSMVLPADYRQWTFLSSGINMSYSSGGTDDHPMFENVFVNPESYRSFMKTGTWPDQTVMILEIRGSETQVSINKAGRVQTGVMGREAHVKDSAKGGWAFYGFPNGVTEGKLFAKSADCYACHEKNGAVDTTFAQFYPTLVEVAKQHGTYRDSGH